MANDERFGRFSRLDLRINRASATRDSSRRAQTKRVSFLGRAVRLPVVDRKGLQLLGISESDMHLGKRVVVRLDLGGGAQIGVWAA